MQCLLCGHSKAHKHGKMPNGHQRYPCPVCQQTFSESFDSLDYRRHISTEQIRQVLQAHSEGSSLRGISRTTKLADNTVVSIVRAASQKANCYTTKWLKQLKPRKSVLMFLCWIV